MCVFACGRAAELKVVIFRSHGPRSLFPALAICTVQPLEGGSMCSLLKSAVSAPCRAACCERREKGALCRVLCVACVCCRLVYVSVCVPLGAAVCCFDCSSILLIFASLMSVIENTHCFELLQKAGGQGGNTTHEQAQGTQTQGNERKVRRTREKSPAAREGRSTSCFEDMRIMPRQLTVCNIKSFMSCNSIF